MKVALWLAPTLGLLCAGVNARPSPEEDMTPGWGGTISANGFVIHQRSQFNTDDDNAITKDLNNRGQAVTQYQAIPLGRLHYTTASGSTQFFIGQSKDQVIEGQLQAEAGITQRLGRFGTLTVAYFPKLPGVSETWRDPFLTNAERDATDVSTHGGRIAFSPAFIPLTFRYAYVDYQLDDEDSGNSLLISSSERKALVRDSDYHQAAIEFPIPLSRQITLLPRLNYTFRQAEGNANDFNAWGYQLGLNMDFGRHSLNTVLRYSDQDYQNHHPVFGQERDATQWSASLLYLYHAPFGWQNAYLNLLSSAEQTDSDIRFYQSQGYYLSAGIGYRF